MRSLVSSFVREFENLGKKVERHDSEKHSGGKSHDEVQSVLKTERDEASNENRREGDGGENGSMEIHREKTENGKPREYM